MRARNLLAEESGLLRFCGWGKPLGRQPGGPGVTRGVVSSPERQD